MTTLGGLPSGTTQLLPGHMEGEQRVRIGTSIVASGSVTLNTGLNDLASLGVFSGIPAAFTCRGDADGEANVLIMVELRIRVPVNQYVDLGMNIAGAGLTHLGRYYANTQNHRNVAGVRNVRLPAGVSQAINFYITASNAAALIDTNDYLSIIILEQ